ncbi:MAG: hypothetical protein U0359_03030 [Byssovorax sp.]
MPTIADHEEKGPLRDTIPPPVPVAVYVKTMMSQAEEDDDAPTSSAPQSWRGEPPRAAIEPRRGAGEALDEPEGGVLSLRASSLPELPITAEVNVGDLVDLVTLDEIDALAKEGAIERHPGRDRGALDEPAAPMEPSPHTLRTPETNPGAAPSKRSQPPEILLGAPMEPEPLLSAEGAAVLDPSQSLDPFNYASVIDEHPFSARPARPVVSEVPSTKPWSSSPPREQARSGLPAKLDPRGSIPPILAAWSTSDRPAAISEPAPNTKKGPFGEPSPIPPRPEASALPRTAPSAPIRTVPLGPPLPVIHEPEQLDDEDDRGPADHEPDYLGEIQERLDVGDDYGAMTLAENLLAIEPDNTEASQCVEICRGRLIEQYLARLGGRRRIPRVVMDMDEIRYLGLDHRAGFLLANIDGTMTVDEVLDISGMAEFDALKILDDFRDRGVIEVPEPRRRR